MDDVIVREKSPAPVDVLDGLRVVVHFGPEHAALEQRAVTNALEEAGKLATPEAVRVTLPGAIIKTPAELDQWLAGVRQQVEDKLKDGPVIL